MVRRKKAARGEGMKGRSRLGRQSAAAIANRSGYFVGFFLVAFWIIAFDRASVAIEDTVAASWGVSVAPFATRASAASRCFMKNGRLRGSDA